MLHISKFKDKFSYLSYFQYCSLQIINIFFLLDVLLHILVFSEHI